MVSFPSFRTQAEHTAAQIPDIRQLALRTAFHILHGTHARRKPGAGDSFWQFRDYQPGDMPREIDWRQSAKTDRVYIRQHEQHTPQSCIFWCKQTVDMDFQSEYASLSKRSAASVLALTLALLHSRGGEMIAFGHAQRPGHSEKTLQDFETLLGRDDLHPLPDALKPPRHASFYALSDFLDPVEEIAQAFTPIAERTHNGCFIQVLDPAEATLPYKGRVLFENMNGGNRFLASNVTDLQSEYLQRLHAHTEELQTLCRKWGWRFIRHQTDQAFVDTLRPLWLDHGGAS